MDGFHDIITNAQSPDKQIREDAEKQLFESCDANATNIFGSMMQISVNNEESLANRQFTLLTLRKLISMYWSPGFESYRATSNIDVDVKKAIRDALLKLCLDQALDSKIKNCASYCAVQIAAVDFPDEWPGLLQNIYQSILNQHSIEAITLMNDIYDDVMSEEMFFEGGIGVETIKIVFKELESQHSPIATKIAVSKLFHSCLLQMVDSDQITADKRQGFISECLTKALETWSFILNNTMSMSSLEIMNLKSQMYEDLTVVKSEFSKQYFPKNALEAFKHLIIQELNIASSTYSELLQSQVENEEKHQVYQEYAVHVLEFLSALSSKKFDDTEIKIITDSLKILCCLNRSTNELWENDYNSFISKESGLTASFTPRDQAASLVSSLKGTLLYKTLIAFINQLNESMAAGQNWREQESLLFLIQNILSEESETPEGLQIQIEKFVPYLGELLTSSHLHQLVQGRIILLFPKFLEKFMETLSSIKQITKQSLLTSIDIALKSNDSIVKASTLIAYTYYSSFAELASVLSAQDCDSAQRGVLRLIKEVEEDAEEDTFGVIAEVINCVIDANSEDAMDESLREEEFFTLISISSKDPANVQVVSESTECLEKLLEKMDLSLYTKYSEKILPSLIDAVNGHQQTQYAYSPLLSLALQFITIFLKMKPDEEEIPGFVFASIFLPLKSVIMSTDEDESLQLATEALSFLIYNSQASAIEQVLNDIIEVLSRLLSLDVSDSGAMNVGSLIVTICSRFSNQFQELMPMILRATTDKFIDTKNISTTQNLLSVFSYLVCSDPEQTVQFLHQLSNGASQRDVLTLVLQKWLDTFEIVRGEKRIKENILALTKLYYLQDSALAAVKVNGDLIPYEGSLIITRSMAKSMPDRYTEITVYEKIVKLFVAELAAQNKSHNVEDLVKTSAANNDEDDDWEDVDDVLDYEKLQEYVDDESDDMLHQDHEISGGVEVTQTVLELLIEFFRDVTGKNVSSFQHIYTTLSEEEKKTLAQTLV